MCEGSAEVKTVDVALAVGNIKVQRGWKAGRGSSRGARMLEMGKGVLTGSRRLVPEKKCPETEAKATLGAFQIMADSELVEMWALGYKVDVYWPC